METATILAESLDWTAIVIALAIGWTAGCLFMWRYMLRICDDEHAKVLELDAMGSQLHARVKELETEIALRSNFNNQMAAEIVDHRISAGARVKATTDEPAPKCEHCDKRMEWVDKLTKWVCLCKLRETIAQAETEDGDA